MYRCCECGTLFEQPKTFQDYRGECWGTPAYETITGCPYCEGGYEEVAECELCGKIIPIDEMDGPICRNCAEERGDYDV